MEKQRVLVFGPCGNVGFYLLPMLLSNPNLELHLAYHQTKPQVEHKPYVYCVQVDLRNLESLRRVLSCKPQKIIFMLPTISGTHPLVVNFVSVVKEVVPDIRHIVYISEGDIDNFLIKELKCYDNVMDSFKLMVKDSLLPVTRLEPCGFMQNFVLFYGLIPFLRQCQSGTSVFSTGVEGTTKLAWVDALDIASLVVEIINCESENHIGKHYQIASDIFSMEDFVKNLGHVLGRQFSYSHKTREILEQEFQNMGMSQILAADRALAFSTYHEGHFPVLAADPSTLRSLIKRTPTTLDQFLERNCKIWKEEIENI